MEVIAGGNIGSSKEVADTISLHQQMISAGLTDEASGAAYETLKRKFWEGRGSLSVYTDTLLESFNVRFQALFDDAGSEFPTWWMDVDSPEWAAALDKLYSGYQSDIAEEQNAQKVREDTILGRSPEAGRPVDSYLPHMIGRLTMLRRDHTITRRLPFLTLGFVGWMAKAFTRAKDAIYEVRI